MDISEIMGYITVGFIIAYFVWMFAYDPKDEPKTLDYEEEEEETRED